LIAEQVEKVDPDLVVRDEDGKLSTVRYEAINAMLLNEFLKEHRKAVEERGRVEKLEGIVAKQQKQIETLITGLQKASARVEVAKSSPQLVADDLPITNQ
jgi:hypothetical protein